MEFLGVVDLPVWLILLICCIILIYRYGTCPYHVWKDHDVDGPTPVPFFGNCLQMFDSKKGSNYSVNKWQQKYGRVFGIYFFRRPFLLVTDPEVLKEIFVKQFSNFSDRFLVGDGALNNGIIKDAVFFVYGSADWHRIRRIMSPTFSSGKLRKLVGHINRTAHHLSDNFQKNAHENCCIDAKDFFGAFALDVIAGLAFGLKINSQSDFNLPFVKNAKRLMTFKTMNKVTVMLAGIFPPVLPLYKRFCIGYFNSKSVRYFERCIETILSERKDGASKDKQTDFLELLLDAEAEDENGIMELKLSPKEVAAQCILFIIAGYETTSSVLQFLFYELARNMSVQNNIYEEIQKFVGDTQEPTYDQIQELNYTAAAIFEALRMYPPINMISRQADKACTVNGFSLPAKAAIGIPVYNIGRDPAFYDEPDCYKPERFLNNENPSRHDISFLPFGFGPRHCIGSRLAMIEIKLALVHLLRKVIIQDATPKNLELEDFSGVLVPKEPIKLSVRLR